jgi:plasmid stabilization system protein ParE
VKASPSISLRMNYTLDLPPDTRRQIGDFIEALDGSARRAAVNAILDELGKLAANPKLGSPVYGGPLERRRIHRFLATIGPEPRELQFAYKLLEATRTVLVSGFDEAP